MTEATTAELEECDAVFRGGITSGVIYPGAIAALAAKYRLRCIGGGSAGAIAAGIAAAAEYGRTSGKVPDAFDRLGQISTDVSGGAGSRTSLDKLFRPGPKLVWLNRLVRAGTGGSKWAEAARQFAPAVALALAGSVAFGFWTGLVGWSVTLCLVILLSGLGLRLYQLYVAVFRTLPKEGFFGLCPGTNEALSDRQDLATLRSEGALMDWMHATVQELAGRDTGQVPKPGGAGAPPVPDEHRPLTMRDLWGQGGPTKRDINLSLPTTNLTQQLPYQFPFLERDPGSLYFRPAELAKVLPRDVVRWLVISSRDPDARVTGLEGSSGLRQLPLPADLPVLLGVRLSLSFPGLLAAVPLWALDRPDNAERRLVRCWFSDGGITSNFPISSFDGALPTRPTFGFDLREATPEQAVAPLPPSPSIGDSPDPMVVVASTNSSDMAPRVISDIQESLPAFLSAIVATARNSRENELMLMPGYRDRIVHIAQKPGEGGLNLGMDSETIQTLSNRGATAAQVLVSRFHPQGAAAIHRDFAMGWPNHRWVRYRTLMAAVERLLAEFRRGAGGVPSGLRSYPWPGADAAARAKTAHDALLELAKSMAASAVAGSAGTGEAPSLFDRLTLDGKRWPGGGNSPRPKMGLSLHPIGRDPGRSLPY